MANANAVIIRKAKLYKRPSIHNLLHNCGLILATYWIKSIENMKQHPKIQNQEEANKKWNEWISILRKRYKQNNKNKRELRSDAVIIEEGLIVIGRDVVANQNQIIQILNEFLQKFSQDNNIEILHVSYHNHEGHLDDDNNEVINRHIHFLFSNISKNGLMVRRNWKRDYLKKLQDDIFEISKKYIHNIERGQEAKYEQKNINGKIVNVNIKKHIHPRVYRLMKEQETLRNRIIKEYEEAIENKNNEISNKNIQIEQLVEKNEKMKMDIYSSFKFKDTDDYITFNFLFKSYKKKYEEQNTKFIEQRKLLKKISKFIEKHQLYSDINIDILDFIKNQNEQVEGLEIASRKFFYENCLLRNKIKSLESSDIKNYKSQVYNNEDSYYNDFDNSISIT
ncbi:hypothetical protein N5U17_02170 [Aliarcobacter butzleri]|uniref:hypothetical protein n=1 Tax=Aliarcobacter butzleri TaxID=28197 RepID=UPI0021B4C4CB|nr:hypothetical protein [Aliarcobacter butzleri]MCT7603023.1 hypothetical protein [Aliarcobacter butzleri]